MSTDQKVEMTWETPPPDEIVKISAMHVQAMEGSDSDDVWVQAGMHHVILNTKGRKSGKEHKVALPYWRDSDGNRVVVASFAGAKQHPSWFLNLRDREDPEIFCQVQGAKFWSAPEILEGDEHDAIWRQLNEDRSWYDTYQSKTDRQIPLVRLPETRPA